MTTEPSRKKGVTAYQHNPFKDELILQLGKKKIKSGGIGHYVGEGGEVITTGAIYYDKVYDKETFVKVYSDKIRLIFELKRSTQKVLQFLIVELQKTPNADSIYLPWFDAEHYFSGESIKMGRTTFHRALHELLDKKFIAESTSPNRFWLNPSFIFNGNRMSFIETISYPVTSYSEKPLTGDSHLQQPLLTEVKK